jgi:hypothetical protein
MGHAFGGGRTGRRGCPGWWCCCRRAPCRGPGGRSSRARRSGRSCSPATAAPLPRTSRCARACGRAASAEGSVAWVERHGAMRRRRAPGSAGCGWVGTECCAGLAAPRRRRVQWHGQNDMSRCIRADDGECYNVLTVRRRCTGGCGTGTCLAGKLRVFVLGAKIVADSSSLTFPWQTNIRQASRFIRSNQNVSQF